MVDVTDLVRELTEDEIIGLIKGASNFHPFYNETVERADIMSMFYNAKSGVNVDTATLSKVLRKSAVESNEDYSKRLRRTPMIPFEKMFVRSKERIFQGHGVTRDLPESDEFWDYIQRRFDDQGQSIDKFFREKAFHYKEVLGFAGIVVDLITHEVLVEGEDGQDYYQLQTYSDSTGNPVPYTYLVRPEEIYDFEMDQGHLKYVILRRIQDEDEIADFRYTVYTPTRVHIFDQVRDEDYKNTGETHEQMIMNEAHPFGEVPFVMLKGEEDMDSGFQIGRPERFSLIDLYRMAIEIAYDLQEVSLLYAHPVPVMSETQVKELIGAIDREGNYNPETISAELGAVVQIPDSQDFPNKLFFQADTAGLDHLKDYLFEIIDVVHKFASIRDKTQVVSNVSGVAKALDTVEERGVLAASSRDMEDTERKTLSLMSNARTDVDFDPEWIQYQKEFDLSTASEHMDILIEGSAQNALTFELYKYHALEGLRKGGASQTKVDEVEKKLEEVGKPIRTSVQELLGVINKDDTAFTESLAKQVKILEHFLERRKDLGEEEEEGVENDDTPDFFQPDVSDDLEDEDSQDEPDKVDPETDNQNN